MHDAGLGFFLDIFAGRYQAISGGLSGAAFSDLINMIQESTLEKKKSLRQTSLGFLVLVPLVIAGVGLGSIRAQASMPYASLYWAPTYTMTSSNLSSAPSGGFSPVGGGAGLGLMFSQKVGLEAQGFYITRSLNSANSNQALSTAILLRIKPVRWFALGLGGYLDNILGGQSVRIGSSRINDMDFGLKAGGGLNIPMGAKVSLLLEAYYKMGIGNLTSAANTDFKYNMLMGQVGLSFHGSSK